MSQSVSPPPEAAGETYELTRERRLGQRMHAFSNMVQSYFYGRTEQPLGIALSEWRVLRATLLAPGISQAEVAAGEGISVMSVSRAVTGLRRKQLIEAASDPEDRRKTLLSPSQRGRELGEDIAKRERVMYEHLFSVLSDDERNVLDDLLSRVNEHVQNGELPPTPPAGRDWQAVLSETVVLD